MSYGSLDLMANSLNEKPSSKSELQENVIFSGSSRDPWKAYVGDASDWQKLVTGKSSSTAYGALTVMTVDGEVQEDSRSLVWSGEKESQFYWQSAVPADLSTLAGENGALMMELRVDKHPIGRVDQRMDCGWPCSGSLDMSAFFRSLPEGQWARVGISLRCFNKVGVNLTKVATPFVLVSSEAFAVTLRDVRVVANAPKTSLISCS